jgi:hypothetical protein
VASRKIGSSYQFLEIPDLVLHTPAPEGIRAGLISLSGLHLSRIHHSTL